MAQQDLQYTDTLREGTDKIQANFDELYAGVGGGAVDSVFGRTGVVIAVSGDYSGTLVTNVPAGNIAATTVQAAINELDSEKQATLVSATNIKTVNGVSLLGSGDLVISGGGAVDSVNGQTGVVILTKTDVGLANVDNTSDATKNAASVTLTNKTLTSPIITTPTGIVKGDVGLANVDNTSDLNKPVSTAQATAIGLKVSKAGDTMTGALAMGGNKVTGLGAASTNGDAVIYEQITPLAPLDSPTFINTPIAPTASGGTNTTQIATTAFVQGEIGSVGAVSKIYAHQNFK